MKTFEIRGTQQNNLKLYYYNELIGIIDNDHQGIKLDFMAFISLKLTIADVINYYCDYYDEAYPNLESFCDKYNITFESFETDDLDFKLCFKSEALEMCCKLTSQNYGCIKVIFTGHDWNCGKVNFLIACRDYGFAQSYLISTNLDNIEIIDGVVAIKIEE